MKLTKKEREVLEAIRDSEYQNGDPVGHAIWMDYVIDSKSRGGVFTSLQRKGFVTATIVPFRESGNKSAGISDSIVSLTQAGFDAISQ